MIIKSYIEKLPENFKSKVIWVVFWSDIRFLPKRFYKISQTKKEAEEKIKSLEGCDGVICCWFDRNEFKRENGKWIPKISTSKLFGSQSDFVEKND
jgi:hypothetical protein